MRFIISPYCKILYQKTIKIPFNERLLSGRIFQGEEEEHNHVL